MCPEVSRKSGTMPIRYGTEERSASDALGGRGWCRRDDLIN